jgi:ribosomal protein L11 methyltransferase
MAFWQLAVAITPEIAEGLTNFLWEHGALGVVEEERPPAPPTLVAFFPETASSTGLVRELDTYRTGLAALGFPVVPVEPEISVLRDEAWATAWQRSFTPLAVGQRLLVLPPWEVERAGAPERLRIVIEPGRAFGTGHHGSTEGCLRLLERALRERPAPAAALDIGTGTGILAVAALRLGVPRAVALDIDPDAVHAAGHNAAQNGVAEHIEILLGGPEAVAGRTFPLVLANLLTHAHLTFADRYAALLAPGGILVLGGILSEEADRVADAVARAGFDPPERLHADGWCALLARARRI